MTCNLTITVPDATAVVKDSQGNILATELIASGESKDIIVEANAMINVLKGDFTGEFDLSVQDQNGFYNDYESATIINTLSIAANPTLGALATVRIIGGSLAADAVPVNWAYSGDVISQDTDFYNEIMILYVSSTDIRIVNRLVDAPDVTAPLFAVAPASANIAETSFDITATLDENGTVYGYLLADGAAAPDTDTVIANAQQSFADVGSGGTLSFTGLVTETNYDVYVVAVDTAGNKQASPVLVEVLTSGAISAEAQAVINRMTTPTATEQSAIANFVDTLVTSGDWPLIDEFQFFQMESQVNSLVGWKGVASATNNSATWVQSTGFTTNGSTAFINTSFNPLTDSVNYTLQNAMLGAGVINNRTNAGTGATLVGARDNELDTINLFQSSSSTIEYRLHLSSNNAYNVDAKFNAGNYYTTLQTSSTRRLYKGGTQAQINTQSNNTAIPNASIYVGALNDRSSTVLPINADLSFFIIGGIGITVSNIENAITQLKIDLGI